MSYDYSIYYSHFVLTIRWNLVKLSKDCKTCLKLVEIIIVFRLLNLNNKTFKNFLKWFRKLCEDNKMFLRSLETLANMRRIFEIWKLSEAFGKYIEVSKNVKFLYGCWTFLKFFETFWSRTRSIYCICCALFTNSFRMLG